MNKELIQQLLDDDETRARLAVVFGQAVDSSDAESHYDDFMLAALNKLIDIPVVGDVITIEVSDHMWVRGEYVRAGLSGMVVEVPRKGLSSKYYQGKHIKLKRSEMSE